MTFAIAARCPSTGMLGISVTSSSVCVSARCGVWARAGAGVVITQNVTDPRLGHLGLRLLEQGHGAQATLDAIVKAGAYPEYRQLGVVDADGEVAFHSGEETLGTHAIVAGEGCLAAGNLLASDTVPQAMVDAFTLAPSEHIAERLLKALEAGSAAGGEASDVRSAGLYVVNRHVFPIIDLRVDWHETPLAKLRRTWRVFEPQMNDYITRAFDPSAAPSYGVPGDV